MVSNSAFVTGVAVPPLAVTITEPSVWNSTIVVVFMVILPATISPVAVISLRAVLVTMTQIPSPSAQNPVLSTVTLPSAVYNV